MKGFNLSAWALAHRTLVLFLILAVGAAGAVAYLNLGRAEDPSFTFKVMTIRTEWPGASAREVERFVTDEIEKKLEEVPYYDYARSYSKPGESVVFLVLKDYTPPRAVADIWYQARKKIGDIGGNLPEGVKGPYFNDEFGDVYSAIYAFTGVDQGFSPADLKKIADEARERLLRVAGVQKVDLIGTQDQRIYVEVSNRRLAALDVPLQAVLDALARENAVSPAGNVDLATDRIYLRIDVGFDRAEAIRAAPVEAGGRIFTIGDLAEVRRGYVDPPQSTMRWNGRDAIGLGVVMAKRGNVLALGEALATELARIRAELPAGVEIGQVADQPRVVERSVGEFQESLAEALAIVMAVSLLSLGWRTGIVVALTVPLVLAATMVAMLILGIDLHRISLGALIIALGLLVDDAIIAIEMMVVKIEQGWDRLKAGAFAYTSTAFPMLTGTIVTAAGFVPVGFAQSAAGEYTNAIFWVVALSLVISWFVAVVFTPYLGFKLLPKPKHVHPGHDVYDRRAYRIFRRIVEACVRARWVTIGVTVGVFAASIVGFGLVQQQFFPSASRPELLVDIRLAEGSSFAATAAEVAKMETLLSNSEDIAQFVVYTGAGSPRFYLPLDQQLQNANFAQFVVMSRDLEARERVKRMIEGQAADAFPGARVRVSRLENGPPVGYPVQFRVLGSDPQKIREIAYQLRDIVRANPNITEVLLDWDELAKQVRLDVDLSKARALGVSKQDLASALEMSLSGLAVTQYREGTELIDVILRTPADERLDLAGLADLNIATASGTPIPLGQVATVRYELEEPILWRRGRLTAMTVKADIVDGMQAPVVSQQIEAALATLRAGLPDGYRIEMGGAIEESAKGQGSINKMMPLMLLIMVTVLMLQLQSFSRVLLVLLTAPLGLIGVTAALLVFNLPFGFVAMLGTIALGGIIMRNSVILVDQIDQDIAAGHGAFQAVVDATVRRARPILLTAAAAVLAMIPLAQSAFWGPMAVAIMGGLTVATLLTLLFLPALYAAWFRVKAPEAERMMPGVAMLAAGE